MTTGRCASPSEAFPRPNRPPPSAEWLKSGRGTDPPGRGATASRALNSRWRTDRRIYARALTMDRPRSVTAGVLRPSPAARSSRADRGPRLRERIGGAPGSLPGRDAERFGVSAGVVLGQHLTEVAGPVGDGAVADLTARDRELGNGHGEAAGPCIAHHLHDASPVALTCALRHTHATRHERATKDGFPARGDNHRTPPYHSFFCAHTS